MNRPSKSELFWTRLPIAAWMLIGIVSWAGISNAQTPPAPSNRVVIVIDGSGSFQDRQAEAVERAVALLDAMAQKKLHRWEPATDTITIISLDAFPQVLWQGALQDLKGMDRAAWVARFRARTDYAGCTDVGRAFRLAVQHLEGDPRYVHKYLFVFSDLVHEPPTTSISTCRPPSRPSLPPDGFPWEALRDVSVAVFWVPPDQILAWQRAVEEHGLASSFALYTTSDSAQVKILPPPTPTVEVTEAERQVQRERYTGLAGAFVKSAGVILMLVVLSLAAIVIASRLRNKGGRPAPGVRPPLPVGSHRPAVPPLPGRPRPPAPRTPTSSRNHHPQ